MRKILAYFIILVFLTSFVSASDLCKESDDGKDYEEAGFVKYGVTQYDDLCVLSPDAEMRLPESQYLKEYYCDKDNDLRKHKVVSCAGQGFEKCKDGRCIQSETPQQNTTTPTAPVYIPPVCGNKKVDSGEVCDPPDKICYQGSDIGLCSKTCQCDIKITSGQSVDEEETTEEQGPAVMKAIAEAGTESTEDPDGGPSTEKNRLALPKEPKKGLFGRIWGWFAGLFS